MAVEVGRDAAQRAEILKALAHPVRLLLLRELAEDEECVCHLSHVLRKAQPYVSKQLAALREAGVVLDRRDGQRVFYRLADDDVAGLVAAVWRGRTAESAGRKVTGGCPCPKCD